MTTNSLSLNLAGLRDHGFGVNYELLLAHQRLTAAIRHDEREQPLIARSIALARLCVCGVRELQLPILLRREDEDRAQRVETDAAMKPLGIARIESRAGNALIEGLQTELSDSLLVGRWTSARRSA